jgi:hypothetical protein
MSRLQARVRIHGTKLVDVSPSKPEQVIRFSDFVRLLNQSPAISPEQSSEFGSIEVKLVHGPGLAIFVTEELICGLTSQQKVLAR